MTATLVKMLSTMLRMLLNKNGMKITSILSSLKVYNLAQGDQAREMLEREEAHESLCP